MKPDTTTDNRIFTYAFTGVLLFIAALVFAMADFTHAAIPALSSSLIVGTLGFSSFSLLFKAIKKDKDRMRPQV